jgi:hypothetical protein
MSSSNACRHQATTSGGIPPRPARPPRGSSRVLLPLWAARGVDDQPGEQHIGERHDLSESCDLESGDRAKSWELRWRALADSPSTIAHTGASREARRFTTPGEGACTASYSPDSRSPR